MTITELTNHLDVVEVRASDGDGRTVEGRVVPFDAPTALYGDRVFEVFRRGAFARTLQNRRDEVPLYLTHDPRSLIGRSVKVEERSDGLHASFRVSETEQGEEALTLIRDGALHSFSIGFIPVPAKTKIVEEGEKVTYERNEVKLDHVALVPNPAFKEARVLALRDALGGLDDDTVAALVSLAAVAPDLRAVADAVRGGALVLPATEARSERPVADLTIPGVDPDVLSKRVADAKASAA